MLLAPAEYGPGRRRILRVELHRYAVVAGFDFVVRLDSPLVNPNFSFTQQSIDTTARYAFELRHEVVVYSLASTFVVNLDNSRFFSEFVYQR